MPEGPDYLKLYLLKRLDPRHPDHKRYIEGYAKLYDEKGDLTAFYESLVKPAAMEEVEGLEVAIERENNSPVEHEGELERLEAAKEKLEAFIASKKKTLATAAVAKVVAKPKKAVKKPTKHKK